ncbi:MAG: Co2+/Mg2+ efflux protein ApaG [Brumimicrobium sp.]
MNIATTKGIKITVTTDFRVDLTKLESNLYFYNYTIKIENLGEVKVQLISRYWRIVDSLAPTRIIEGSGVIGEQPIIDVGETYEYSSGCDLSSDLGYMEGYFEFITLSSEQKTEKFQVEIPRFKLEYLGKLN